MPKFDALQSGFNAGELSPLMYGATDLPRYKKGLATCLNYLPTLQGPLNRRAATKYMATVLDITNATSVMTQSALIPFQFSITQAYMLEFNNNFIRFYANNGQVVSTGTNFNVQGTSGIGAQFFATRATNVSQGNGETVTSQSSITPGAILVLKSPYASTDVLGLRFVQSNDTIYLYHANYPTYKLQRHSAVLWQLTQIAFSDGPYLEANSYLTQGDSTNVQLVVNGAATAISGNSFFSNSMYTGPYVTLAGCVTDPASSGKIQVTTSAPHGYVSGQQVCITGVVGTTEANTYDSVAYPSAPNVSWTITVTGATTFLLNGSTFVNNYVSSGAVHLALFSSDVAAQRASTPLPDGSGNLANPLGRSIALVFAGVRYSGFLDFTVFTNAYSINFWTTTPIPAIVVSNGTPATAWYFGTYCNKNGFASCGTFHQDRLIQGGVPGFPQEVDGSNTGDGNYENFAPSIPTTLVVGDNNALQFNLNSTGSNAIKWFCSNAQGLLAGTAVSEWAMTPASTGEALTPTNFNAQQTSFYGSTGIQAIQCGNAAIYVQNAGRKVREMNFFFQVGTFRSNDLTELSEHITLPSVLTLALQKETQPLIWANRADGNLVSLLYDRSDVSLSVGWTRHQLGGQSDSAGTNPLVTSIAIIPSVDGSFDQMWMVVTRYINGSLVQMIEYMTKIFDDSMIQEDAFQGDCGATFYNPVTITGITNASTAVVTAAAHGFSNGFQIKIVGVVGLNKSSTDVNGNVTISNLVNEKTFVVAGATTNTFQLNDFSGNPISSTAFGAYVSGGQVAKLVTTISGINWLEGETVGVLADGSLHPAVTVSNAGSITLAFPAAKVQIGYPFKSQGQLLRLEGGAADGTSIGKTRRTTRVAVQMHRCGDLQLGNSSAPLGPFTNMIPVELSQADQNQSDMSVPLFSGIKREGLESGYDFESQVCFQQSSMLPGCIQSITSFMEEQDV